MSGDWERPPQTGDARLDEALEKVAGLAAQPLSDHPTILAEAEQALQALLDCGVSKA